MKTVSQIKLMFMGLAMAMACSTAFAQAPQDVKKEGPKAEKAMKQACKDKEKCAKCAQMKDGKKKEACKKECKKACEKCKKEHKAKK